MAQWGFVTINAFSHFRIMTHSCLTVRTTNDHHQGYDYTGMLQATGYPVEIVHLKSTISTGSQVCFLVAKNVWLVMVANYNFEKLSALHQPIARVNARHSSELAKKASSDEMSGLKPCIFLAKGACVMLTVNLWTDVGLCNGATGTLIDFIYANNNGPPDLPEAVIVKFDKYRGPSRTEPMKKKTLQCDNNSCL